jgi:hypothetical protein
MRRVRIPLFGAAEMHLFGIRLCAPQPAKRLADGTTIALY